jgi:hypothetical protein
VAPGRALPLRCDHGPVRSVAGGILLAVAVVLGAIAGLWTVWRAVGAEVDYCPDGGCITAYWITVPGPLIAALLGMAGLVLLRRRR